MGGQHTRKTTGGEGRGGAYGWRKATRSTATEWSRVLSSPQVGRNSTRQSKCWKEPPRTSF
eukprot:16432025-Heterocapsa_arctica.AAC.1